MLKVIEKMEKLSNPNFVIVSGDFNEWRYGPVIEKHMKKHFTSAYGNGPDHTIFTFRRIEKCIKETVDYVFFKGDSIKVS